MESPSKSSLTVLLIFPPSVYLNYTPPLNLAYIAAILEQAGHRVHIIDASSVHGSRDNRSIVQEALALKPDVIGITLNVMFTKAAYELAAELRRELPKTVLIAGGPHPSLTAEECLQRGFQFVVRGEGEQTVTELMETIIRGEGFHTVAGISYIADHSVVHNPDRTLLEDLNTLPMPAKHLFNRNHYVADSSHYQAFGPIFSGRGCPGRCTYCYKGVFGDRVRVRSAENVFAEMCFLNERYGLTAFEFLDDAFSVFPARVEALCNLILQGGKKWVWQCTTRLDLTSPALLEKMHQAGCFRVFYGFESGDEDTLKLIKKKLNIAQAIQVLQWTHEIGMKSIVGFMYGFPWETVSQVHNTTRIIKRLRPYVDEFNPLGIMIPVPGTEIYKNYAKQYGFENWWLEDRFGYRYRSNAYFPYFRKRFYNDFSLLEDGFFTFPPQVRRAIIKGTRIIGTHNIFHNMSFPKNLIVYLLVHLSLILYRINPDLEKQVFLSFAYLKRVLLHRAEA